jgi:beta-N-acetylhexosaminidase
MPLTLEEKIGRMLVFGWQGNTSDDSRSVNGHASWLIEDVKVGGVILMGRNIGPRDETKALVSELQELASANGLPKLLIATDQEGGRVARLEPPFYPAFPSAKMIGEMNEPLFARRNASEIGRMLKDVGINWALAPVLDVNNNPGNQVIGDRSFGESPDLVSALGVASVNGLQTDAGVMACGKHFPGHGDTTVDSHLALPILNHSLERLSCTEFLPFTAAIKAGVGSIMTSHILFQALDPLLPATLSPTIITGLLRRKLGFDGVVVTDCLEMWGVAMKWGTPEAAVLAAIAGADMLLVCHTRGTQNMVCEALLSAVRSGRLSEQRIDEANWRIEKARRLFNRDT